MREIYLWIIFFIVIMSVFAYIRFYYQPAISMSVSFSANHSSLNDIYQYQKVSLPIVIENTGSTPITNMSIGVLINNNITITYDVVLPAGKVVYIPYNYSASNAGNFNVTVVADPGRLYNIADRQNTQQTVSVNIIPQQNPNPFEFLPSNWTSESSMNTNNNGYLIGAYLYDNYSVGQFTLTGISNLSRFLYPVLNVTTPYIVNMSFASTTYSNASAYSVWFDGYVDPSIMRVAAEGYGLNTSNDVVSGYNVTFVKINDNTTLCSWYNGGWIKNLAYEGDQTCLSLMHNTANTIGLQNNNTLAQLNQRLVIQNTSDLANYNFISGNMTEVGKVLFSGSSFSYAGIWHNGIMGSSTCYGIIEVVNDTSYCSTYLLPKSSQIGTISLVRTSAFVNDYNLTVLSLVNSSYVVEQVPINIGIIKEFNITGPSINFTSGLQSECSFNESIDCTNPVYGNSNLTLELHNVQTNTINLNWIACWQNGSPLPTELNVSMPSNGIVNVTSRCYSDEVPITGVALNLNLNLALNYSIGNETYDVNGTAYIPGFG